MVPCVLFVVCGCLQLVVNRVLSAACRLLFVVRRSLFVVGRTSFVVVCC